MCLHRRLKVEVKRKELFMKKIGITVDCVCDLPDKYLKANDIDVVFYNIITSTGRFKDGDEITSENILEYLESGGTKSETSPPSLEEYRAVFDNALKRYEEIVHFSLSDKLDSSVQSALNAIKDMGDNGKRVTVIDTENLSTGMGHMIMKAVEMRDSGCSTAEIVQMAEDMKSMISTTFITKDVDYLYRNGRVSKAVKNLCGFFSIYPVLIVKNGELALKTIKVGNYDKAVMRYIKGELKNNKKIDKKRLFITHAGCPIRTISKYRSEAEKIYRFDEVLVTKTSATISSNCGPGTVGVLFVRRSD